MQRSESREPTYILYVAIKVQDSESDAEVSKKLDSFCEGRLAQLKEGNLRRSTQKIPKLFRSNKHCFLKPIISTVWKLTDHFCQVLHVPCKERIPRGQDLPSS